MILTVVASTSLATFSISAACSAAKLTIDIIIDGIICATFTSAPSAFAALSSKIPLFLHEGNAKLGKANKLFSRWAKCMALGFPLSDSMQCKCPYVLTGMPVRPELLKEKMEKSSAIKMINQKYSIALDEKLPLILIFGGSQGAAVFNKTVPEALLKLAKDNIQVIHLTGAGKYDEVKKIYSNAPFPVLSLEKSDEMGMLYSAADMVICRSGGSSIAELAVFAKYAVLVPYPFAADKHQDDNAAYHASSGGADLIKNENCTVENILDILRKFAADPGAYIEKGKLAGNIARPNASTEVLALIDERL
jgi:UDP-N-acetylglucosamine--N-acetylmuramyl-(pentapeptide) pyrophosphoryl-undecaprenol N-acetylglucosamine transferase